jgi:DNA-binding response OmpR family regulator
MDAESSTRGGPNPEMTWLLVAEDDDDLRKQLADALREHGYDVHTAADGSEVVQMLDVVTEMPAAVLLDLVMPHLGGREVLRAMRGVARTAHVPVVILSGVALEDHEVEALGVAAVLLKPAALQNVFAVLDGICRAPD